MKHFFINFIYLVIFEIKFIYIKCGSLLNCDNSSCYAKLLSQPASTSWSTVDVLTLIIAIASLVISILAYISTRELSRTARYWDRWRELSSRVLDKPALACLWCDEAAYLKVYGCLSPKISLTASARVFTEMYLDLVLEIRSSKGFWATLIGRYPGDARPENPLVRALYWQDLRSEYSAEQQIILDQAFKDAEAASSWADVNLPIILIIPDEKINNHKKSLRSIDTFKYPSSHIDPN